MSSDDDSDDDERSPSSDSDSEEEEGERALNLALAREKKKKHKSERESTQTCIVRKTSPIGETGFPMDSVRHPVLARPLTVQRFHATLRGDDCRSRRRRKPAKIYEKRPSTFYAPASSTDC